MSGVNAEPLIEPTPVFTAELRPYRSLGRSGFRILLLFTFAVCFFNAVLFLTTGALPVALFFGLDFVLLYGAFHLNYRAARAREHISMSPIELRILKISPAGKVRESRYNPFWARFDVDRHHEFGITSMAVVGQGRRTPLGTFLGAEEKESFASAFTAALARIKRRI
jgi:uncharacterized membrane protein